MRGEAPARRRSRLAALSPRPLCLLAAALPFSALAACATAPSRAALRPGERRRAPARPSAAWSAARERAPSLPASRLLYDARMA